MTAQRQEPISQADGHAAPRCLSCEDPGLIMVFGSNAEGNHAAGAAKHAVEKHGAIMGKGHGFQGDSFAVITMSGFAELKYRVSILLDHANLNPDLRFFVTPIGCGIAGYKPEQIAPLFSDAPPNCTLPEGWRTK